MRLRWVRRVRAIFFRTVVAVLILHRRALHHRSILIGRNRVQLAHERGKRPVIIVVVRRAESGCADAYAAMLDGDLSGRRGETPARTLLAVTLAEHGQPAQLNQQAVHRAVNLMATRVLRVLAFARRYVDSQHAKFEPGQVAADLTFTGAQGMIDPLRSEAVADVRAAESHADAADVSAPVAHRSGAAH